MINDNVISLINVESLRDFEARSGLKVDHERFRANIVIDGLAAMQELELAKKKIKTTVTDKSDAGKLSDINVNKVGATIGDRNMKLKKMIDDI